MSIFYTLLATIRSGRVVVVVVVVLFGREGGERVSNSREAQDRREKCGRRGSLPHSRKVSSLPRFK